MLYQNKERINGIKFACWIISQFSSVKFKQQHNHKFKSWLDHCYLYVIGLRSILKLFCHQKKLSTIFRSWLIVDITIQTDMGKNHAYKWLFSSFQTFLNRKRKKKNIFILMLWQHGELCSLSASDDVIFITQYFLITALEIIK